MKKLTLTFCALFALFVVAPAIYADGPEKYSGKEKEVMQPAPPVCDFYRAHEWDLSIWGAYAFAADTGRIVRTMDAVAVAHLEAVGAQHAFVLTLVRAVGRDDDVASRLPARSSENYVFR